MMLDSGTGGAWADPGGDGNRRLLRGILVGSAGLSAATSLFQALMGGGSIQPDDRSHGETAARHRGVFRRQPAGAGGSLLLQALFRNPLADPLVLGVSGGAAIRHPDRDADRRGPGMMHGYVNHRRHFGGGDLLLARGGGGTRLLLCGVVLASASGALITVLLTLAEIGQLRGMVFWLAGDLSWAQHPSLQLAAAAVALLAACIGGRWLNVLARVRGAGLCDPQACARRLKRAWDFLRECGPHSDRRDRRRHDRIRRLIAPTWCV